MKVGAIGELTVLSKVDQSIYDILSDRTVGRKVVVDLLRDKGFEVSEKLVRTWRQKQYEDVEIPHPSDPVEPVRERHVTYMDLEGTNKYLTGELKFDASKSLGGSAWQNTVIKDVPTKRPMTKTSKTIVIMPDVQAPLHDEKLVKKFIQFLADYEPDELAQVGDFTDSTEISRWVRGKKGEYAGDLQMGLDSGKRILERIRDVHSGRFRIVRSNHDDRLELYIAGCAPGLEGLEVLSIENLAGFNEYDVEFIRDEVVELTPMARDPWIMCHGDEGSLNSVAGRTAFNLAKNKFGANVVCGHTHRAGLTSESYGYNGKIRDTRHGLEVGHFMDLTKADYLKKKGVAANWQQAFGILHVHGSKVYPQLVPVDYEGNFSVEGKLY